MPVVYFSYPLAASFYKSLLFWSRSDEVLLGVEVIIVVAHGIANHIIDIDSVAQEATDTTEAFHKLEAIRRLIGDKLNGDTVVFVMKAEPVGQLLAADNFKVDARLCVLEVLRVLLLLSVEQESFCLILYRVLDLISHNFDVFKQHHCLKRSEFEGLHRVLNTESYHARVECNLLEEAANDALLLHELHVEERVLCQRDCLIETLVKTVRHVNSRDDQAFKPVVEVIALLHHEFEVSAASNDDTSDIWSIILNEVLRGQLAAFDDVKMTLLLSETRETNSRLTTATVLLRQLDWHTLNDLLVVALKRRKEHSVTIDNDESKLVIVLEEREQRLRLKTILTSVAEDVDGSEWFEGNLDLLLGVAVLHQDDTTEDYEAIGRNMLVQLKLLSSRSDGRNDRLACLTRLDGLGT